MYSNIEQKILENEIDSSLQELSRYSLDSIKNALLPSEVLTEEIRKKIFASFQSISNSTSIQGSIKNLEKHLKQFDKVSDKIKSYQAKEDEIEDYISIMDDEKSSHRRKLKRLKKELSDIKESIDKLLE